MSSVTVLSVSGSLTGLLTLISPWATDTLRHSRVLLLGAAPLPLSDSRGQALRHRTFGSCRHTLTHVHTQDMKREETVQHRISSSCWRSHRALRLPSVHLAQRLAQQRKSTSGRKTDQSQVSPLFPPTPTLTCFYHTENSWLYSLHTSTQWRTHTHTHLSQHWLVYQFPFGMWEQGGGGNRDDEFKNILEQSKSTGDFWPGSWQSHLKIA